MSLAVWSGVWALYSIVSLFYVKPAWVKAIHLVIGAFQLSVFIASLMGVYNGR